MHIIRDPLNNYAWDRVELNFCSMFYESLYIFHELWAWFLESFHSHCSIRWRYPASRTLWPILSLFCFYISVLHPGWYVVIVPYPLFLPPTPPPVNLEHEPVVCNRFLLSIDHRDSRDSMLLYTIKTSYIGPKILKILLFKSRFPLIVFWRLQTISKHDAYSKTYGIMVKINYAEIRWNTSEQ